MVATPLGNLSDITLRALDVIRSVDLLICEDTRTTQKILNRYNFSVKTASYYAPRENQLAGRYIEKLKSGKTIALVSESGTPCISDPGYEIVKRAHEEGIRVSPIPGPSALSAALSISGIKADNVFFSGFIPRKKGKRKRFLDEHVGKEYTFVFFDSKYRIKETLNFIKENNPKTLIFVGRELTKKFEETIRGTAEEVCATISSVQKLKGEFVIVCSPLKK